MSRFSSPRWLWPLALLAAMPLPAADLSDTAPAASGNEKTETARLMLQFHTARNNPQAQVRAVVALAGLGADAVAEVNYQVDKQLRQLGAMIKEARAPTAVDGKIAELRKVLADLRNGPDLSKDKLEKTGLPALDQLNAVYRQWQAESKKRQAKLASAVAQLRPLAEFLRLLDAEWKAAGETKPRPLPVGEYLGKAEALLAQATAAEGVEDLRILAENARLAKGLDVETATGMQALNAMRMMCGLKALATDLKLCEAARDHCKDMKEKNFFAHESPVPGKKTPSDRAQKAGTTAAGENIYKGSGAASAALKAWFLSPGHHKNMLHDSFTRQGMGREADHWTSMFGQGNSPAPKGVGP